MNNINIDIIELIKATGTAEALFVIILLSCHFFIFKQYNARLKDRQDEIDRLAQENHEYRDRFLKILDSKLKSKKED